MEKEKIDAILKGDEKLLWSGGAGKFKVLDEVYKPKLIKDTIISLAVLAALIAGYIALAAKNNADVSAGVIIVLVIMLMFIPVRMLTDSNKLMKKIRYLITDKRLIIITNNVESIAYAGIKTAKLRTDKAGMTSLVCGKRAIGSSDGKLRGLAATGCHMDENGKECDAFVFYALDDPDEIKRILKPYIEL